jgi:multicomponent Na+:H+ antiporter subunit F
MELFIWMFMLAGLLSLLRAALGPTFADRYLGVSAFSGILTLGIVYYALESGIQFYLDIAIVLVMLSFTGSLAVAKYAPEVKHD